METKNKKGKGGKAIDPTTYSLSGFAKIGQKSQSGEFYGSEEGDAFDDTAVRSPLSTGSSHILGRGVGVPKLDTRRSLRGEFIDVDNSDASTLSSSQSSTSLRSDQSSSSLPVVADKSELSEDDKKRAVLDIAFKTYFVQRAAQIMIVATNRGSVPETALTRGLNLASGITSLAPIPVVDVGSILNAVNVAIQNRNRNKEAKSAANIVKCFLGDSAQFQTEPFREMVADLAMDVTEHCFDKVKVWSSDKKGDEKQSALSRLKQKIFKPKGRVGASELDVVFSVCDFIVEAMESKEVSDIFSELSDKHIIETAATGKSRRDYVKGRKEGTETDRGAPREVFESPRYRGLSDPKVRERVVEKLREKLHEKWREEGILKEDASNSVLSPSSASSPSSSPKLGGKSLLGRRLKVLSRAVSGLITPTTGGERM